ncbi:MAG: amidohydrolase family protein [Gammaproteobacteria bacterium]|jgi:imidazolonepropionase-like amidohydrolase|nr:amidohydrolase family protein [Gammaproteobacteria bacterium]|tara:strand:+ start:1637 stop:2854 length:1218 start_codon:yes stop_codon:yes gene_type:complete
MRVSIDNVVLLEPATEARVEGHLVIEDGVIREVSSSPGNNADIRIDGRGKTVIPGLIDCHVHVTAATADFPALRRWSPAYTTVRALTILSAMIRRGFTTVRDAGGADWGLAQAIQQGHAVGPRLRYCGQAISQTGGHGDMREPGDVVHDVCHCAAGLGRIADGVAAVRTACRDEIRKGATHIKIMASGGVSSTTDRLDSTQFSMEELRASVEEAEAANIYVMAHAYTARAINRALEAGIRSIEHGNYLDQSSCDLFKQHEAYFVPTLATYFALPKEGLAAGLHPSMVAKIGDTLDRGLEALELAHNSGVSIAYGTDLLGEMQKWQLHEFALRREVVGIANALRSATSDAARLLNMEGQVGTLAPGAFADVLLLDQDPLEVLDTLENLEQHLSKVLVGGSVVYSAN